MYKTIIIFLLSTLPLLSQVEYFTINTYVDPSASYKENGLDIGFDIEYVGLIYTKVGVENFAVLEGGYTDLHAMVGFNLNLGRYMQHRLYLGVGAARVFRNGGAETNHRFEMGYDWAIKNGLFFGLRYMRERRFDMQLLGWQVITRDNGYVRIGYRWSWKNRSFER